MAVSKETNVPEDEEKLDEAAMRAAEIHEVLVGLKDFKARIIEGKFIFPYMKLGSCEEYVIE